MSDSFAIVLTDVVDSTQLNDQVGDDAMAALWAAHDRTARDLVRRWHGREIGRSDGFLLMFKEASDAVGFALDYHEALAALHALLRARVGVHVGPVSLRRNTSDDIAQGATPFEIDGVALPIAARVMSVARGGQTLLTAAAIAAAGAIKAASIGHWRLKGLAEPLELFDLSRSDTALSPPSDSAKAYRVAWTSDAWLPVRELPHSLPVERDEFIGRAAELRALAERFETDSALVTVLGMGGIGKTRLAQRYARLWLGDYPGGAWFCDLSAAITLEGVVNAVARGLGIPLGRADPIEQISAAIAGRATCLIILDNFEQVAALAEPTLGAWLEHAPQARFLVTSRQILGIAGEQVHLLPTMDVSDAAGLFRQRVAALGVPGPFAAEDESALAPLMALLDGLPLAIELAAARADVLSPSTLLRRMGDRFKVLPSRPGRNDRQATLRAALDWSWALLSKVEQSALAQLSVFHGGFTLEAAETVVDVTSTRLAPEVVNIVQSLVEKSFLRKARGARFDMLRTVHDYAAEQFQALAHTEPPFAAAAHERHAKFFADLHETMQPAALCGDLDNLVAAVRRASVAGWAAAAVGALQGVLAAIKLHGPFGAVIELADQVRGMRDGLDDHLAARVELVAGWGLKATGRIEEAEVRLRQSLTFARLESDTPCRASASTALGELLTNAGRMQEARTELDAALAAAKTSGSVALESEAASGLGSLSRNLGRLDEARSHYEYALHAARRAGDRRREGGCLGNLGVVHANLGHDAEAEAYYRESLAVARELGDLQWEGNALCNLGLLHQVQGRYADAADEFRIALRAGRELGHVRLEGIVLCNLGMALEALDDCVAARQHYEAALHVARSLHDGRTEGQILGYLGQLLARQGEFAAARQCLDQGEALLTAISDRLSLGLLMCGRAECEHRAGAPEVAAHALRVAQEICADMGAEPPSEIRQALVRVRALVAPDSESGGRPLSATRLNPTRS